MKKYLFPFILIAFLNASETDKLFRGSDSVPMRQLSEILLKVAPLDSNVQALDILLETRGKGAAIKAQNFIKDYPVDPISTWMLLVLADYYSIEGKENTAKSLLSKAKTRDDVIANDAYYRMINSKINGNLISSPGLKQTHRNSTLLLDLSRAKKRADAKGFLAITDPELPALPLLDLKPKVKVISTPGKFHLQVGAFSERSNTNRIVALFRDKAYPVQVREKRSGDRRVYLVWIGNYHSRDSASEQGKKIEEILGVKSFIVMDP